MNLIPVQTAHHLRHLPWNFSSSPRSALLRRLSNPWIFSTSWLFSSAEDILPASASWRESSRFDHTRSPRAKGSVTFILTINPREFVTDKIILVNSNSVVTWKQRKLITSPLNKQIYFLVGSLRAKVHGNFKQAAVPPPPRWSTSTAAEETTTETRETETTKTTTNKRNGKNKNYNFRNNNKLTLL